MNALATPQALDGDLQLMRDAQVLLDAASADDEMLAELATRYLDHDAPAMPELRAALAARLGSRLDVLQSQAARRAKWPASWIAEGFNRCMAISADALQFLASNPRPAGGGEQFNAEHLHQLADELNVTLEACFPRAPGAVADWPKLTAPARVGDALFSAGVSARLVVETAQRAAAAAKLEAQMSPEARREQESARRALWDRLNGPLEAPREPEEMTRLAARLGLQRTEGGAAGAPKYKIFGADLSVFMADMGVELEDTRTVDLQSLRQQLLEPRVPMRRDAQGFWSNPSLPLLDEDVNLERFLAAFGLEGCWVAAEDQLDVDAYDRCVEAHCWSEWNPAPRKGDGWVIMSIHDTEGGAVAGFIRAKDNAGARPHLTQGLTR